MVTESPEAAHTARAHGPELTAPDSLANLVGGLMWVVAGLFVISIGQGQLTCLGG